MAPITYTGPMCARPDCSRTAWRDGLCVYCWRLAYLFGKDPKMFAYQPLQGYGDERSAVELPWEEWEREAQHRGRGLADLFAEGPTKDDEAEPGNRRR
ncbi:MAG: hypothetical protein H0V55_11450 [Thermoleophilaceae bacterium]|nr:hypothetical protein [Thermoleophilaceae bacterium]